MHKDTLDPIGQSRPEWMKKLFNNKGFIRINRDPNTDGSTGGATTTEPPANPPATPATPTTPAPAPAPASTSWLDNLDDGLKTDPTLSKYKDVPSLAKSHVELQKLVGYDKLPVPNQDSPAEVWDVAYARLGRPQSANDYQLPEIKDRPETLPVNEAEITAFKEKAHQLGYNQKQTGELYEWYMGEKIKAHNAYEQQAIDEANKTEADLRKEWGSGFDQNKANVQALIGKFAKPEEKDYIVNTFGNDPVAIRVLHGISQKFSESGIEVGASKPNMTPADAQVEYSRIMSDPTGPFFNAAHPEHNVMVDKMRDLKAIMNPAGNKPVR